MKQRFLDSLICLMLLTQLPTPSAITQNLGRSPQKKSTSRQEAALDTQRNGLHTLLYLRDSVFEVEKPEDRIRVLLEVADTMWLLDKELAREVFKQSFARAVDLENTGSQTSKLLLTSELRQMVITRIARRDAVFADSLLRTKAEQTPQKVEPFAELYGQNGARSDMLVKAASESLSTDQSRALQMARLAASDGLSQRLRLFLLNLREKDPAAADALFDLTLKNASARAPKELVEALFHWDYVFQRDTIYLGPVAWFRDKSQPRYPVAATLRNRALAFAVEAINDNAQRYYIGQASENDKPIIRERYVLLHSVANQILPDVARFMPQAQPIIESHLSRIEKELRDLGRQPPEAPEPLPQTAEFEASVEQLIEDASKSSKPEARDGFYAKAALRLYLRRDYQRAINEARKIENRSLMLQLTEPINFDYAGELLTSGQIEAAAVVVRRLERPELRAALFALIGAAFLEQKNPADGIELLNEAELIAGNEKPSSYLSSATLGIAQAYFDRDRNKARELTSSAIRLLNSLTGQEDWEILDGERPSASRVSVEDKHWTTRDDGGLESLTVTYPAVAGLQETLARFSEVNLDEALLLAQQLKSKGFNYAVHARVYKHAIVRAQKDLRIPPQSKLGRQDVSMIK